MVFNSSVIVTVARVSAKAWQWLSCIGEPVNSDELLDLLFCFPLQQLGRLALCLCSFLCLPQTHSFYSYIPSDSDFDDSDSHHSSSSTLHFHDFYYHSHSD